MHITKKSIIALFLMFFLECGTTSSRLWCTPTEIEQENSIESNPNKKYSKITKYAHFIFGALALELCFLTADNHTQSKLIKQLQPHNLLKNFLYEYGTSFFVTCMHELGHAYAAHYLNGNPIDIHLGASPSDLQDKEHTPFFTSKHVSLHGLNPNQALTSYSIVLNITTYLKRKLVEHVLETKMNLKKLSEEETHEICQKIIQDNKQEIEDLITTIIPQNIKKQAAILLAGSIAGITSATFLSIIITMIKEKTISRVTLLHGLKPNSQVFRNLTNMIIPRSTNGHDDASKLYHQCLGISNKPLAMIAQGAALASIAAEIWLAYDQAEQKSINNAGSIGFVALFNYFMRGYLRLTV